MIERITKEQVFKNHQNSTAPIIEDDVHVEFFRAGGNVGVHGISCWTDMGEAVYYLGEHITLRQALTMFAKDRHEIRGAKH